MNIGIVGLGLIGGSMAKAIKEFTGHTVWGQDKDFKTQAQALAEGVLDGVLDEESLGQCQILLLALYPRATIDFLFAHADKISKNAWVVDLCGVKEPVCQAVAPLASRHGFYFAGGHPMAGRERSGYGAAEARLFCGASMLLTPPDTGPDGPVLGKPAPGGLAPSAAQPEAPAPASLLQGLETFFLSLGFRTVHFTSPAEHDQVIAYTSQLAHVLSNAYVKSTAALQYENFAGGSFQDLTRVATLNVEMWTELFFLNRENLIKEIDGLCGRLAAYSDALSRQDAAAMAALLQEGCDWKARISSPGKAAPKISL